MTTACVDGWTVIYVDFTTLTCKKELKVKFYLKALIPNKQSHSPTLVFKHMMILKPEVDSYSYITRLCVK